MYGPGYAECINWHLCSPRGLGVCGGAARQPSVVAGFKGAALQSSIDVGLRLVICAGMAERSGRIERKPGIYKGFREGARNPGIDAGFSYINHLRQRGEASASRLNGF